MDAAPTKRREKKVHPYYTFDRVFSYNCTYMFVVGGRGLGKTYGAKKKAIASAIKRGEEFIYLRRYKDELKASVRTFTDDLQANEEFPDFDFRVNGNKLEFSGIEFRDEKKREWATAGHFLSLSTAQSQKSVAFPKVTLIIFDEFIIEKGAISYLPNEANVFNNFYSTVDRWQDKTRVLFLANSVAIMNPYFLEYKIRPAEDTEWIQSHEGFMVAHFAKSSDFAQSVKATAFGRFISGTSYENYAIGNQFSDNSDSLIALKESAAKYRYTVQTAEGYFAVWYNAFTGKWFITQRRPGQEYIYTTEQRFMDEGKRFLPRNAKLLAMLRAAFNAGRLWFDHPISRNAMSEIFKR